MRKWEADLKTRLAVLMKCGSTEKFKLHVLHRVSKMIWWTGKVVKGRGHGISWVIMLACVYEDWIEWRISFKISGLNPGLSEYEAEVLMTKVKYSVLLENFSITEHDREMYLVILQCSHSHRILCSQDVMKVGYRIGLVILTIMKH